MSSTLQTHLGFEVFFFLLRSAFCSFSFCCAVQLFVYEILINFLCTTVDIYICCYYGAHTHKGAMWTKAITKMNPQRPLEFGSRLRPI